MRVEETIEKCKRDDIRSKELVYKTFYGYVRAVVVRYVYSENDTEELINDSFIKIFNNLNSFIPGQTGEQTLKIFKGWIGKIASRTAIDHLRRSRRNLFIEKIEDNDSIYTPVAVSSQLEANDILALLKKLPQMHSLVFNLYEIEGFSHEEIAQQLQISQSSSRVFLTRAKNKLKSLYFENQTSIVKNENE